MKSPPTKIAREELVEDCYWTNNNGLLHFNLSNICHLPNKWPTQKTPRDIFATDDWKRAVLGLPESMVGGWFGPQGKNNKPMFVTPSEDLLLVALVYLKGAQKVNAVLIKSLAESRRQIAALISDMNEMVSINDESTVVIKKRKISAANYSVLSDMIPPLGTFPLPLKINNSITEQAGTLDPGSVEELPNHSELMQSRSVSKPILDLSSEYNTSISATSLTNSAPAVTRLVRPKIELDAAPEIEKMERLLVKMKRDLVQMVDQGGENAERMRASLLLAVQRFAEDIEEK
ncbi:hypothetical protein BCR33DRAFT_728813 [Rhizoclosmatium globosum]|uniref:Uncharacterized protein n=1 Tax=Rhizoclosmatium globosum TaxID=329046 RepID=A0A1Y2AJ87_9FUNG|nr:hypothetical protein BCR33DRAFT_728813 [Rhizoclosmatium globosum]|eukprot:ORY22257.1 hypothetical protein BCR33DRAFT_728813 [Rhizoclosmatium globosum]